VTDLIEVVQKIDPGSELVHLFELTLPNGTVLYFHPGFETDAADGYIYFRERTGSFNVQTYEPFPIDMSGVEFNSDGAQNRPTLTVANVTSAFSEDLGTNFSNEDLIGQPIVKRTTLKKYLYQPDGSAGAYDSVQPPIEFPIQKYIVDRVSGENATAVTFELAAPFDLSGIQLPNRSVLGKYCSWEYQGQDLNSRGGCVWSKNSLIELGVSISDTENHKAYFTSKDEPIIPEVIFTTTTAWQTSHAYLIGDLIRRNNVVWVAIQDHTSSSSSTGFNTDYSTNGYWTRYAYLSWAASTYYAENDYVKNGTDYYRCNTTHTSGTTFEENSGKWDTIYLYKTWDTVTPANNAFAVDDYVEYNNGSQTTVWKALKASNNVTPEESTYWTRGDMCGKKFSSCKCRFQYLPRNNFTGSNSSPKVTKNTTIPLPFGAFPGSRKFR